MIEVLYNGPPSLEGPRSPYPREEHKTQQTKAGKRMPRRAQTQHEYFLPQYPAFSLYTAPQPSPVTEVPPGTPAKPSREPSQQQVTEQPRPPARRPPLGPPRRSYSVTDKQPIPRRHKPAHGLELMDLPPELHFVIFDFLDPIDSTCLGLTNKHFYAIHRRLHGTVPLTTRREGPNELEWAWHLSTNVVRKNPCVASGCKDAAAASPEGVGEKDKSTLSNLRVRGQGYCRMCGVTRCQLHKHIQEWMGEGLEYCSVKQKYGPVAPEGAKSYCYMSKPGDPRRCGRHYVRKNTVQLR
ncbi:hypothetical protein MYCTH_2315675 [Thermothelomyces thermophilus ATCC 42464]|uniref:F-box domain-containing protein n=1 Tax=Thermothelomyces thermophilus (strain ATCC 42464 / BCRC 31852 / DSM 1799) TaxID=573729 RepID=G2QFM9_THET4|nr:uncharacterized protein MYCTH_2315675 [Thermothelomyces thermophilus ATCC 42464]AEO59246.1 hypothetical protein MYCTH_2315675 [Thermothelomyces thermophilus ATCC 42464]